ncbi:MAG: hypothetical protein A3C44_06925 [Gammaproteobacteria bacterium RIFCSPHIGHO2_02_FULL_39_13]|nr:MAG: hypothetical protein A3C44_06925 [Gammaproteobacteria bacterium RIFCSPHIGHO2_02_FULL_39_13]OGT48165.1 MAG: hypothetical protein A3E53_03140 [Gammaproteobacteria bacterium RIFCSPHIGHO2_12_FULL_39_24]
MITKLNSFSTLRFSGAKTPEFLQGQLTCDMRELNQHSAYSLAAVCDHRGRMLANFWVINWHHDFLFILPRSVCEIVKNHLQKYAVFSKVSIVQDDQFFIAEMGSGSESTSDSVSILLPSKKRHLIISDHTLFPEVKINIDETEWQKNNIADRFCILHSETSLLFTPQMIHLEKLGGVNFTKGCYVGQEIVARTEYLGKSKRHLQRFQQQSDHPLNRGDELKNKKNESVGVIVEWVKLTENEYDILAVVQT